jgi:DNA-binding transcriptional regulator PaaX
MGKRKITLEGVMRFINDFGDVYLSLERERVWRRIHAPKYLNLEDYFPYQVERTVGRLVRKGWVEKRQTSQGLVVELTEKGRKQVLLFDLEKTGELGGKWDGKWRMVFFDVEELKRNKRDKLRNYLVKLGLKQMQRSVWVSPFDCEKEIKYIREVVGIPDQVKLGLLESIENEEDLKKWWDL